MGLESTSQNRLSRLYKNTTAFRKNSLYFSVISEVSTKAAHIAQPCSFHRIYCRHIRFSNFYERIYWNVFNKEVIVYEAILQAGLH